MKSSITISGSADRPGKDRLWQRAHPGKLHRCVLSSLPRPAPPRAPAPAERRARAAAPRAALPVRRCRAARSQPHRARASRRRSGRRRSSPRRRRSRRSGCRVSSSVRTLTPPSEASVEASSSATRSWALGVCGSAPIMPNPDVGTASTVGTTWTTTVSALCSAASSRPNTTASWAEGEPSVAIRIFFMVSSFGSVDTSRSCGARTAAPSGRSPIRARRTTDWPCRRDGDAYAAIAMRGR